MPGGLLQLYAYGAENNYLNGNPQMTFFKVVYKRYTNFAIETINVELNGCNELSYQNTIKLKSKIPRNGDLISNMYFKFKLPDIKSNSEKQFYWCRGVGLSMIDYVDLYIGGSKIERLDGKYIDIYHSISKLGGKRRAFNKLVGIDDYITYTRQNKENYYRGYDANPYNIVENDVNNPSYINKFYNTQPSIFKRSYYVPLNFWFSRNLGLALPLIALQYHDVEIEIQLKPLRDLYTILKPIKKYFYYNNNDHLSLDSNTNTSIYQSSSKESRENSNLSSFIAYKRVKPCHITSLQGKQDHISNFIYGRFIDRTFDFSPELSIDYIFLDNEERQQFAAKTHEFLITQQQKINKSGLQSKNVLDFDVYHPCKDIFWVAYRSDNDTRNEWLNYTTHTNKDINRFNEIFSWQDNWWQHCVNISDNLPIEIIDPCDSNQTLICDRFQELLFRFGPFGEASYLESEPNGNNTILGFTISKDQSLYTLETIKTFRNIWIFTDPSKIPLINNNNYNDYEIEPIKTMNIKFNGNIREDTKNSEFFTYIQPYQYYIGISRQPIYMYSFSVDPLRYQPSGSCNFSRIESVEFEIELKNTPIANKKISGIPTITREYNFDIDFYFINYNVLKIMGGMGGLAFGN